MLRLLTTSLALSVALTGAALSEEFEVHMMNRGEAGTMVFEPSFLHIAVGDTVRFIATDRSHNAETIPDMLPEGAEEFAGGINEEIEVTFDVEGLYGVRCSPHFAMGMVMSIAVGEVTEIPEGFLEGRLPRTAKARLEEQLANL